MALVVFAGIGYVVGFQVIQLTENLPTYQANIGRKSICCRARLRVIGRASTALHELGAEISAAQATAPRTEGVP